MSIATSLYVEPLTGGYEIINNILVEVASAVNKANLLLAQPIGGYIYAPTQGNPLIGTQGILSTNDISQGINTCLAPILNTGEITALTIQKIRYTPTGKYYIDIGITLPSGHTEVINFKR